MKEIKAFVRSQKTNNIIKALYEAKCSGITVVPIHPIGYGFQPNYFIGGAESERAYPEINKLEIVCNDEVVDQYCEIIRMCGYTGLAGDGIIFVSPVECAIKVRTGQRDSNALADKSEQS